MTLTLVEANLQEIYAAQHTESKLVADISGSYIYAANAGWGKFWSWVYKITSFIGLESLALNCFKSAMTKTHRYFNEHLLTVVRASKSYEENLRKRYLEESYCERHNAGSRKKICSWNRSVVPFIKYAKNSPSEALKRIITTSFNPHYSSIYHSPFSEGSNSELIKLQRRIIMLEGKLKSTIPVNLLIKVSKNISLTSSEGKILKKFVHKLNKQQQNICVRELHQALQRSF